MKEIIGIVRETVEALLPYIKAEAIVAMALVGCIFLVTSGIIIYQLAKHHRKGGRE